MWVVEKTNKNNCQYKSYVISNNVLIKFNIDYFVIKTKMYFDGKI